MDIKLLARGNSKLYKTVFCWSIPPVVTCLNCEQCKKSCYARFPYAFYPAVKTAWDRNYELAKTGEFVSLIRKQISRSRNCKVVRIHVSGDFFSQEYVDNWIRIIKGFPGVKFYTYTKVFHLFDFSEMLSLDNMVVINSITFDGGINFGDKERIQFLVDNGYKNCPAVENKKISCGKDCTICHEYDKVCFLKHK